VGGGEVRTRGLLGKGIKGALFTFAITDKYGCKTANCEPAISALQHIFVMIMNTITDFYLMAIPIPMVWKSNLPLRKKLAVLLMFSGGFLEMAFGILRCVTILTVSHKHCLPLSLPTNHPPPFSKPT